MKELDTKTKDYIFNNMINGCKRNNFDYVSKFDTNGNIVALKITHNNINYNISNIVIMGISLLVKEDSKNTQLWDIKKLFDFIKNNKWE